MEVVIIMDMLKQFKNSRELINWLIDPLQRKFYFRGISNDRHLYPSIMRCKGDDLSFLEDELLKEFSKYGSSLVGNINNAFDLISYAQHFGLPTRLVDWTRNPLIALFFAVYYSDQVGNETPRILCTHHRKIFPICEPVHMVNSGEDQIHYSNPVYDYILFIHQIQKGDSPKICTETSKILDDLNLEGSYIARRMLEKEEQNEMIMISSGYSNPRLLAQDGLFYLPRKLESTCIDKEYCASDVKYIEINKSWRTEILKTLEHLGVTKYRLFFDLASINEFIVENAIASVAAFGNGLSIK